MEDPFGGTEYSLAVGVGGGISEEATEAVHGIRSGGGLLRDQGTGCGCGQETRVHGTAVVKQVNNLSTAICRSLAWEGAGGAVSREVGDWGSLDP